MNKSIRTLAIAAALAAMTVAPVLAQNTKSATPATPATPAKTEAKAHSEKTTTSAHHTAWTKEQIKEAQEGLAKGGYFKGQANGVMNSATRNALKAWQKANKMPADGHLTEDILHKLSS